MIEQIAWHYKSFLLSGVVSLKNTVASDCHAKIQEKDKHLADLTRKLETANKEKNEIETKLQEYKQQLLKSKT